MLFVTAPENAADVRAFCAKFHENIRVEYKSAFDENVRRSLPKVLSSFANSLGGVLIVGVETENGVAREPIQGFPTPEEELPLTIENICLGNINPPIIPRIRVIPSDVAGLIFAIIEVEESWEAPHAIENSKKVYVRTGNAANPYEMASVDLIIELVRRRAKPEAKRQRLLSVAENRARHVVTEQTIHAEISASPLYPRRALCTREDCWDFVANALYRGGRYFPYDTVRRVEDGVASFQAETEYGQVSMDGVLFVRRVLQLNTEGAEDNVLLLRELLQPTFRLLHCAEAFCRQFGYRGGLTIRVTANNVRHLRMLFLPGFRAGWDSLGDYECFEDAVSAVEITESERLTSDLRGLCQSLLRQMCWSFYQSAEPFPAEALGGYIERGIQGLGFR
jgi:Schlafen, AlbA_2